MIFIHLCHYCRMVESVCHILFHQFLYLKYCLRFASPFADNSPFLSVTWKKNEEKINILEIYVWQLFIIKKIYVDIVNGFENFLLYGFWMFLSFKFYYMSFYHCILVSIHRMSYPIKLLTIKCLLIYLPTCVLLIITTHWIVYNIICLSFYRNWLSH